MNQCFLSNLTVNSNLLTQDYQHEMWRCSVFELKDVFRRCPGLDPGQSDLPERLRAEHRLYLFWGQPPFPEADPTWPLQVMELLVEAFGRFQVRPELELAWEILATTQTLLTLPKGLNVGDARSTAARIDQAVREVLGGHEFRLTPELIESRLNGITGSTSNARNRPRAG